MASSAEARRPPIKKATVIVIYNGQTAEVTYEPEQSMHALLSHAVKAFGIAANREEMALFNASGVELNPGLSVRQAGVRAGDELVLRQRVVRGG